MKTHAYVYTNPPTCFYTVLSQNKFNFAPNRTHPLPTGLFVERPDPGSLPVLPERLERKKRGQKTFDARLSVTPCSVSPQPQEGTPHTARQCLVGETQGQLPRGLPLALDPRAPPRVKQRQ